ncbi:MAG: DUF2281 domain-containing protein [Bacteroidales bacterium]|nr:DUF2281 domain-containing protein [Bacteroidales bacterium]
MNTAFLYTKISSLPDNLIKEVNDFIDSLVSNRDSLNKRKNRKPGFLKGKIEITEDFDKPLADFQNF